VRRSRPDVLLSWHDRPRRDDHGTIDNVTTLLFYLVIAAGIGLVVFFLAVFVFGRGEQMAPLDPRTSPAELPDSDITSDDVRRIRFALALRGYRMSDVDWTLERLGDQLDALRLELAELRGDPALPRRAQNELVSVGAEPAGPAMVATGAGTADRPLARAPLSEAPTDVQATARSDVGRSPLRQNHSGEAFPDPAGTTMPVRNDGSPVTDATT